MSGLFVDIMRGDFILLALGVCNLFSSCNFRDSIAANYFNDEKFRGVENIEIKNGPGNITIQPVEENKNDDTILELEGEEQNEIVINQEGTNLSIVRRHIPTDEILFEAKPINITLHVAPTVVSFRCKMGRGIFSMDRFVGEIFLDSGSNDVHLSNITGPINLKTGKSKFDIANITGNVNINSGSIEQGNFQNVIGNVIVNSGPIRQSLFQKITGNIDIRTGSILNGNFQNITGNTIVNSGPIKQSLFQNITGDINIKSSQFILKLFEIYGHIKVQGKGNCQYKMLTKPSFPILIQIQGKDITFNAYLSDVFKTISNTLTGGYDILSVLPIVYEHEDVKFYGRLSNSTISVNHLLFNHDH